MVRPHFTGALLLLSASLVGAQPHTTCIRPKVSMWHRTGLLRAAKVRIA